MDIFLAAMLSMIAMAAIVHFVCKHAKLKALETCIAFQLIKRMDAIFGSIIYSENCTCKAQWYMIGALTLMIKGLIFFILATTRKCRILSGHLFSNAVRVMLFSQMLNIMYQLNYAKTAGSIHLFKTIGHITPVQITLKRRLLWG